MSDVSGKAKKRKKKNTTGVSDQLIHTLANSIKRKPHKPTSSVGKLGISIFRYLSVGLQFIYLITTKICCGLNLQDSPDIKGSSFTTFYART